MEWLERLRSEAVLFLVNEECNDSPIQVEWEGEDAGQGLVMLHSILEIGPVERL